MPPLILQPLIENAVTHGIARMVDGGVIRLAVTSAHGALSIVVENPCDPDAARSSRSGFGLENVRRRLALRYGSSARLDTHAEPGRFRVQIDMPRSTDD